MKFLIVRELAAAYFRLGDELHSSPLHEDGTFDTADAVAVERPEAIPPAWREVIERRTHAEAHQQ